MHSYLIHYMHKNGQGRTFLNRTNPIKAFSDIENVDRFLSERSPDLAPIGVISFQELEYQPIPEG